MVGITDARNSASVRLLGRVGLWRFATLDAVFRGEACIEHHPVRRRQPLAPAVPLAVSEQAGAAAAALPSAP